MTPSSHLTPCNADDGAIRDDYPWSIPGHHITVTNHRMSLGIIQTLGEPNQFILCDDCPCPTPKSIANAGVAAPKQNITTNPKKTVIHFDPATYHLSVQQQQDLKRLHQSLADDSLLTITGYTDDTAAGGAITNEALAQHRAHVVLDFLVSIGFNDKRATVNASPLCCYAASNTTAAGRALNRRAEIVITSSPSTMR